MLRHVDGLVVLEPKEGPIASSALWGSCNGAGRASSSDDNDDDDGSSDGDPDFGSDSGGSSDE